MEELQRQKLSKQCLHLPAKEMSQSTRKMLASWLDPPTESVNREHITQDWTGLAEQMNYNYQEVQNFKVKEKTLSLLHAYSLRKGTTVGTLWEAILSLERFDIIEDETIIKKLEKDAVMFHEREKLRIENEKQVQKEAHLSRPVQVPKVTSFTEEPDYEFMDTNTDEFKNMVVDDVEKGETTYFDAFVSYCHDDFPFVQEMIRMLEKVYGLKLCVNARDLLAGSSTLFVTARLIADRCRKVILVMSPSFLKSPECEFQVKVALSLSPGAKRKILIPIMFKFSKMPLVLQHVCLVDYTKSDLAEWFWGRLAASLKESRKQDNLISASEMESLSSLRMNLSIDNKVSNKPDINTTQYGSEQGITSSSSEDSGDVTNLYGAKPATPRSARYGGSSTATVASTSPSTTSSSNQSSTDRPQFRQGYDRFSNSSSTDQTSVKNKAYIPQSAFPQRNPSIESAGGYLNEDIQLQSLKSGDFTVPDNNSLSFSSGYPNTMDTYATNATSYNLTSLVSLPVIEDLLTCDLEDSDFKINDSIQESNNSGIESLFPTHKMNKQ